MKPTVRVLIVTEDWVGVIDGGFLKWNDQPMPDAIGPRAREFHLGEFVSVLRQTTWVGFDADITCALRPTPVDGQSDAKTRERTGADVVGFRFDKPFTVGGEKRTIEDYQVVLYLAMQPGYAVESMQSEADAIARYMDGGGGFFATGDHENLGGTLCPLVPRVRSMRRWFYGPSDHTSPSGASPTAAPGAPSGLGPDRHDTTQPSRNGAVIFENQSDDIAQTITPTDFVVTQRVQSGGAVRITQSLPHPLLCSPLGRITVLPDHMHEGTCEVPDSLARRAYTLDGVTTREYPDLPNGQPLAPVIVATGNVRAGTTSPLGLESPGDHSGGLIPATGLRFGVIGAYDGHQIGLGRVVVDSTFHHFFDINLTGDRYIATTTVGADSQYLHGFYAKDAHGTYHPNDQYVRIQWYFRNLIYWLAPDGLQAHIAWHTLLPAIRHTGLREHLYPHTLDHVMDDFTIYHYHYYGSILEAYLRSVRGRCYQYSVQLVLYEPTQIPWWEWIERQLPSGNPEPPILVSPAEAVFDEFAIRTGMMPDRSVLTTATLGAVLVAIAAGRLDIGDDDDAIVVEHSREAARRTIAHAMTSYVTMSRDAMARTVDLLDVLDRGAAEFSQHVESKS